MKSVIKGGSRIGRRAAAVTDLAVELLRRTPRRSSGITVKTVQSDGVYVTATQITDEAGAKQIGKPAGTYINIECAVDSDISAVIAQELRKLSAKLPAGRKSAGAADRSSDKTAPPRILIVGLGNDRFVADSLGPRVLSYIKTGEKLMTFEPNVKGITGINSVDAIKQITALCKPEFVIAVDSLVCASADRIGCNYQIATTGITPGSGVCRDNKRLDEKFLRVPVIAVGVPICIIMESPKGKLLHATVKDIDRVIINCALNIANGINGAV